MASRMHTAEPLTIDNRLYPVVNANCDEIEASGLSMAILEKFWSRATFVAEAFGARFPAYVDSIQQADQKFTIRVHGEKVPIDGCRDLERVAR